ncbi:hypothetical protein J2797_006318 [Paraburkholderia terricola]|uniref:hypothetical protein n=1 Tax=Paraburkholderia terricola TaxID=169427 RepID=UPI00285E2519|nr:hypothetical protein [Paraburkholderia terricola]MDR6496391.1 hypothetical protein [Paraburkholderia terricola]
MNSSAQKSRKELLIQLESLIGNECYNANIQNYGPGGTRQADGRSFRYPITFREPDGTKIKVNATAIPTEMHDVTLATGYYAFGANQLDIIGALNRVLEHLENHYGLSLEPVQSD